MSFTRFPNLIENIAREQTDSEMGVTFVEPHLKYAVRFHQS
jgi:hypothetical protein